MVALFLAVSLALALVLWAELGPPAQARRDLRAATKGLPDGPPIAPLSDRASRRGPGAEVSKAGPEDDPVMARLAALLAQPEPAAPKPAPAPAPTAAPPPAAAEGLPVVLGYRPGDVIELELEGPAPRPEDITFRQLGRDTQVMIEGFAALVVARAPARSLSPAIFRFRSPRAA